MNDLCDVMAARACEMGFQADHVTTVAADVDDGSDALFVCVTNNAFNGRPSLVESGLRILIMAGRCCVPVPVLDRAERVLLRKIAVQCNGGLSLPASAEARRVFELILGAEVTPWRIGRRASLLAYGLNRGVIIREVLPSFESIGLLWELAAENKRSAVSAAMNKLREELVKHGQLPRTFRFWFEKTAEARVSYAVAALGNQNRAGSDEEPREDTIMRTKEGRKRMDALWQDYEMKRLLTAEDYEAWREGGGKSGRARWEDRRDEK